MEYLIIHHGTCRRRSRPMVPWWQLQSTSDTCALPVLSWWQQGSWCGVSSSSPADCMPAPLRSSSSPSLHRCPGARGHSSLASALAAAPVGSHLPRRPQSSWWGVAPPWHPLGHMAGARSRRPPTHQRSSCLYPFVFLGCWAWAVRESR
jgi:hypothetical protein